MSWITIRSLLAFNISWTCLHNSGARSCDASCTHVQFPKFELFIVGLVKLFSLLPAVFGFDMQGHAVRTSNGGALQATVVWLSMNYKFFREVWLGYVVVLVLWF